MRGLDITITTTATDDDEARELLRELGMPFAKLDEKDEMATEAMRVEAGAARRSTRPRNYHRCSRCGRPRAYYRKFGVCRICLRELAHQGVIPGMTKSSW